MPQDSTTTRGNAADRALNPSITPAVPTGSRGGLRVMVTLTYQQTYNAEDVIDALTTKYGAGKVVSNRDTNSHNLLDLLITP